MSQMRTVLAFFFLLLAYGCAGTNTNRTVDSNNIFDSSSEPKLSIEVSQNLQYLGEVEQKGKHKEKIGSRSLQIKKFSYLFGRVESGKRLERGILVRIEHVQKGSWRPEIFIDEGYMLVEDDVMFGSKIYQHMVTVTSSMFTPAEMELIENEGKLPERDSTSPFFSKTEKVRLKQGYVVPDCYMVEAFGRRAGRMNDIKIMIYYFEDVDNVSTAYTCRDWQSQDASMSDKRYLLNDFIDRNKGIFRILRDAS